MGAASATDPRERRAFWKGEYTVIRRFTLPIAVLAGLVVLAVSIRSVPAQPRGPGGGWPEVGMPAQVGRFVVAHATDKQIVVLDTVTGTLYRATESDLHKASEIPRVKMPGMPPFAPDRRGGIDVKPPKSAGNK
jgi:hypothetical protein